MPSLTQGIRSELQTIINFLIAGDFLVVDAINALDAIGFQYLGIPTTAAIISFIQGILGGGTGTMACATTHKTSTTVQGPGVCCSCFTAQGFGPGNAPPIGARCATTNKSGKCIVCQVKASTSKKHPGTPVFVRGKASVPGSQVSCPSTSEGCCALLGM